jgi:hypothetical protein
VPADEADIDLLGDGLVGEAADTEVDRFGDGAAARETGDTEVERLGEEAGAGESGDIDVARNQGAGAGETGDPEADGLCGGAGPAEASDTEVDPIGEGAGAGVVEVGALSSSATARNSLRRSPSSTPIFSRS